MMKNDILLTPGYFMKNCMSYNYYKFVICNVLNKKSDYNTTTF